MRRAARLTRSHELALKVSVLLTFSTMSPMLRVGWRGGPCRHFALDFLVAARNQAQADRFAARDRGYPRSYFPDLALLGLESI